MAGTPGPPGASMEADWSLIPVMVGLQSFCSDAVALSNRRGFDSRPRHRGDNFAGGVDRNRGVVLSLVDHLLACIRGERESSTNSIDTQR